MSMLAPEGPECRRLRWPRERWEAGRGRGSGEEGAPPPPPSPLPRRGRPGRVGVGEPSQLYDPRGWVEGRPSRGRVGKVLEGRRPGVGISSPHAESKHFLQGLPSPGASSLQLLGLSGPAREKPRAARARGGEGTTNRDGNIAGAPSRGPLWVQPSSGRWPSTY